MRTSGCTLPWLLVVAVLTAGCETVVEVEAPRHEPQLVAHSFFSPDGAWIVRVTGTVPYASAENPRYVDDATVEIWEGDRQIALPTRTDSGTYVAPGPRPKTGHTYTLRVSAPGYAPIEASDALPPIVQLTSFHDRLVQTTDSLSRRRITHVEITLTDPPGRRNYYGLVVVQARWSMNRTTGQHKLLPPTLFTFESDDPVLGRNEFDILNNEKSLYREAFFGDDLVDGTRFTIDFDVQYDAPRPDAEIVIRRVLAVVLLSVSEDFFHYWTTASRQALTNENPFAEPLQVRSNVNGGVGVFAGYQYRILPLGTSDVGLEGYSLDDLCRLVGGRLPLCLWPLPSS